MGDAYPVTAASKLKIVLQNDSVSGLSTFQVFQGIVAPGQGEGFHQGGDAVPGGEFEHVRR
jgi:hypothetical protein